NMYQARVRQNLTKQSAEAEPNPITQSKFERIQKILRERGVEAGTAHKRIVIPKSRFSENEITSLGFQPVTIAIPEHGQDRFQSYRHPDNNFHIHSHGRDWTIHEDRHPAATMLAQKE